MIRLVIDSTCDLTKEEQTALRLETLPLTIHFGQESYRDGIDLDAKGFYQKLRAADRLPTTSQVPPGDFEQAFRPLVEQGDEVIALTLSSRLSATYASAVTAAREVSEERIHVVDTNSGSLGAALLVRRAAMLRDQGNRTAREIADDLRALAPRLRIYAAVDTLKYLKMGGRLSGSAALIGTVLGIKPLVEVREGHVQAVGRIRGEKNVNKALLDAFQKAGADLQYGISFAHADAEDRMRAVMQVFAPHIAGVPVHTCALGAVIGTHTGPGVVAVAFAV